MCLNFPPYVSVSISSVSQCLCLSLSLSLSVSLFLSLSLSLSLSLPPSLSLSRARSSYITLLFSFSSHYLLSLITDLNCLFFFSVLSDARRFWPVSSASAVFILTIPHTVSLMQSWGLLNFLNAGDNNNRLKMNICSSVMILQPVDGYLGLNSHINVHFSLPVAKGHTTLKAPVLVRSPKLSNVGPC